MSLIGPQLLSKGVVKSKHHGDGLTVTGIVNTRDNRCYHYQHHGKIHFLVASSFLAGDLDPAASL